MASSLDAVYAAMDKRLAESRAAQTTKPSWMQQPAPAPTNTSVSRSSAPVSGASFQGNTRMQNIANKDYRGMVTNPNIQQDIKMTAFGPIYGPRTSSVGVAPGAAAGSGMSARDAAMGFWEDQRVGLEKANEDTLIDRRAMLDELADFKAKSLLNNEKMNQLVGQEEEKLKVNTEQIIRRVQEQFGQMGRAASPYMMAELSKRLALQNKDKVDTYRTQLEVDRAGMHKQYLDGLYEVLGNTKRSVMDPQVAAALMQQLGKGQGYAGGGGILGGGGVRSTGRVNRIDPKVAVDRDGGLAPARQVAAPAAKPVLPGGAGVSGAIAGVGAGSRTSSVGVASSYTPPRNVVINTPYDRKKPS